MVLPFSTVKAADLKGNMLGFGDPGAREMRVFGALLSMSAMINTKRRKKKTPLGKGPLDFKVLESSLGMHAAQWSRGSDL